MNLTFLLHIEVLEDADGLRLIEFEVDKIKECQEMTNLYIIRITVRSGLVQDSEDPCRAKVHILCKDFPGDLYSEFIAGDLSQIYNEFVSFHSVIFILLISQN